MQYLLLFNIICSTLYKYIVNVSGNVHLRAIACSGGERSYDVHHELIALTCLPRLSPDGFGSTTWCLLKNRLIVTYPRLGMEEM